MQPTSQLEMVQVLSPMMEILWGLISKDLLTESINLTAKTRPDSSDLGIYGEALSSAIHP